MFKWLGLVWKIYCVPRLAKLNQCNNVKQYQDELMQISEITC